MHAFRLDDCFTAIMHRVNTVIISNVTRKNLAVIKIKMFHALFLLAFPLLSKEKTSILGRYE